MPRQQRRRERRRHIQTRNEPVLVDERPWYYRYGYHIGVWSGAALGVAWYAVFRDLIGLIIGIVTGQIAGLILSRMGRES